MNKKYSLYWLIAGLLSCSACSNVRQAPVVDRREADIAAEPAVRPDETVPAGPQTGDDSTGDWMELPQPDDAAGSGTGPPQYARELGATDGAPRKSPPRETPESAISAQPEPVSDNPAVIALLDDTDTSLSQGNAEGAVSSVERALRLEPKNPWLWHRLAVLRLQQGQWQQAIALAEKSNSLSVRHPEVRKANAAVIDLAGKEMKGGG